MNLQVITRLYLVMMGFCALAVEAKTYCMPTESCWPSKTKIDEFLSKLSGDIYFPNNTSPKYITPGTPYYHYTYETIMSRRFLVKPAIIVVIRDEIDIQLCIQFAKHYNIRLSVISSGHDFIGRNSAAGSLQINVSKLDTIDVDVHDTNDSPGGTVTVGAGTNWKSIYHELDSFNRVVLGGNSPLVSPSGYTLGGGHSPITRKLGLAVDNVIWIRIVTADGKIAHVSKDGYTLTDTNGKITQYSDQEFFWALRGGGGGTFGVVTMFKFKIHFGADKWTSLTCSWKMTNGLTPNYAKGFMNFFAKAQKQLTDEWGGYLLMNTPIYPISPFGAITVAFGYWGNLSAAYESSAIFRQYQEDHPESTTLPCFYQSYSSFWERQKTVNDTSYGNSYLYSINIEPKTWSSSFSEELIDSMWSANLLGYYLAATGIMVGRKSREFSDASSAVTPSLRNADMVMVFSTAWDNPVVGWWAMNVVAKPAAERVYKFARGGYLNEPDSDKKGWQTWYWGPNYDRLLEVKRKWDPDNMFTCHHCVGSEKTTTD